MDWLYYGIFFLFLLAGVTLNVLTLPGNWLMLVAAAVYGWATGWRFVGWKWLVAILVVSAVAEVVEFASAGKAAAKFGGSRWGSAGAIVGGVVGGICLTGLIPIPILGTLAGILVGTFLGSAAGELVAGKRVDRSMLIGAAATKGRLVGTILKVAFGVLIALGAAVVALPVW
jgi:uncharacterized protein YqgC (DUF456 family)